MRDRFFLYGVMTLLALLPVSATAQTSPSPPLPALTPLVIWDGRAHRNGVGETVPTAPEGKILALSLASPAPDTSALIFHVTAEGSWVQGRWRWSSPAGVDVSPYARLALHLRVTGSAKPGDLTLSLASGAADRRKTTVGVRMRTYADTFADGQWHQILIPLRDLVTAASGNNFDPQQVTDLTLGTWNEHADFTVEIDEIAFTNAVPPPPPPTPAEAAVSPPPPQPAKPKGPPPPPGHAEQMKKAEALRSAIYEGMNRSLVEAAYLLIKDGGLQSSDKTRYYLGDEVMVEVPYDTTGGPFSPENRVKGPIRIYRSPLHFD